MFTLRKYDLPDSVEVDGKSFLIKTDFRWWLSFCLALKEKTIETYDDADFLYREKIPKNREKGYQELLKFFRPERKLPRATGRSSGRTILDYEIDAPYIYAAFLEQYGIDLLDRKTVLHWWKFNALLDGLHGTRLNEIQGFRSYDESDKSTTEQIHRELLQMWGLDSELTEQEQKDLEEFNKVFK